MQDKILKAFFSDDRFPIDIQEMKDLSRATNRSSMESSRQVLEQSGMSFGGDAKTTRKDSYRGTLSKERSLNRNIAYNGEENVWREDCLPLSLYKKMSYDPRIILGMLLIKGMASSLKWDVTCDDPKTRVVVEYGLNKIMRTLVREMVDFSYRSGWFMAEKVWTREELDLKEMDNSGKLKTVFKGNAISPKKVKALDPLYNFRYYRHKTEDDIAYIEQYNLGPEPTKLSREKIFWFALDQEYGDIFGRSRFKGAYKPYYYGQLTQEFQVNNIGLAGNNPILARYPEGDTYIADTGVSYENDELAASLIEDVLKGGAAVLSSAVYEDTNLKKWDIEFPNVPLTDLQKYKEAFDNFMSLVLEALGIPSGLIHGDNNASELDAKIDLFFIMFENTLDQIETSIQKELVDWIVLYNFGQSAVGKATFQFDRNGLGRRAMLKELLINMLRVSTREGAQPKALPSIMALCEDLGIKIAGYEDIFMKDPYKVDEVAPQIPAKKKSTQKKENGKISRQADQNGEGRLNPKPRNRERPSKANDITARRR